MRLLEFTTLLLVLPLMLGCGDSAIERIPVSGEVLLDGQLLTSGSIRFVPQEGRPSSAAIQSNGRFELSSECVDRTKEIGAAPGHYRVQVASSKIIDDKTIQWNAPSKYADFRTSGLEITIDKPTKDLRIKLSSDESSTAVGSRDRSDIAKEAPKP
ncbi:MAG TPA: hypothetical protein VHU84_05550 [Lacipirellulaceae bacterium]|nr:hypothetical protein [Lacipirellulaceae bacterium]